MISASLRSPTKNDATAVIASKTSSGERNWRPSTGSARARCERTAFGPTVRNRRAASAAARPSSVLPSRASTSAASSDPAAAISNGARPAALPSRAIGATATSTSFQPMLSMLAPVRCPHQGLR